VTRKSRDLKRAPASYDTRIMQGQVFFGGGIGRDSPNVSQPSDFWDVISTLGSEKLISGNNSGKS